MLSYVYLVKVCENLPSVEGGVWKAADTLEGSNATLQCSHGYEMIGESTDIYCSNGSWSDFDNVGCALLAKEETTNITYSNGTTTKALPAKEETTTITYNNETTTIALPETSRVQSEESSGNQNVIIACVVVLVLFVLVITGIVLFR